MSSDYMGEDNRLHTADVFRNKWVWLVMLGCALIVAGFVGVVLAVAILKAQAVAKQSQRTAAEDEYIARAGGVHTLHAPRRRSYQPGVAAGRMRSAPDRPPAPSNCWSSA